MKADFHVHTTYSDGAASPEQMILAAIARGFDLVAITDHSHTPFDLSYCMKRERVGEYRAELLALKEKYRDRIDVRLGIEEDLFSGPSADPCEVVIGSAHYLRFGDDYVPVDESESVLRAAAKKYTGGDTLALAERYFSALENLVNLTRPTVIGHFDLIRKYNRGGILFDESSERYRAAARRALDALLPAKIPFEINVGAISRGYTTDPYPAAEWIDYIRTHGGSFVFSSDAHKPENIGCLYDTYAHLL